MRHLFFAAIIGFSLIPPLASPAQTTSRQFLSGRMPEIVSHLTPVGRLAAATRLNLVIELPLRNRTELENLIQQIYDPASPNFRHYLTTEQFTEMFGPTERDYQTVIAFAQANGLKVTGTSPNRLVLDVSASAADVERIFHVTMRTYRHPTENRIFFAPDTEPSIDLAVPILHVGGLNNYSLMRPANLVTKPIDETATTDTTPTGSGPGGAYMGNDFRAAYAPGVSLNGSGQIVGLLEFDGFHANDIRAYELSNNLPNVTVTTILLDGYNGAAGSGNVEVALDIDMAIAMAPGLSNIIVYEAPNNTAYFDDILNCMATNNLAKQISSSWTEPTSGTNAGPDQYFLEFKAQGQSFFQASGDHDAYSGAINSPADDSYITIAGGTFLSTTGPAGSWTSETAWNRNNGIGTGGGISTVYPIPTWQQGINTNLNRGSITYRNIPDVAMVADYIWIVASNGIPMTVGGTSCAAPLWAGFTALVNQQAIISSHTTIGFVNPAIYAIGSGPNYTADFHDITTGNNFNSSSPSKFPAVTGYDLCTGWGTPNGMNLITALATPDPLGVVPGTGFSASGPYGGPFNITSQNFFLSNSGGTPLNWSLLGVPLWLNASSSGGSLAPGGNTSMTVSLNSIAGNLLPGVYSANLLFSNLNSGISQIRTFTLQSGQSIVQNGGFESGTFSSWTFVGTGPYINFVDNGSYSDIPPHSGTYLAAFGQYGSLASLSQILSTQPGQSYLLSLWLANPNSAQPTEQFTVNWNTNTLTTNTIFSITNPGTFNWTNLSFIVTAAGTNTTLQFRARNDPNYFGLDDISVQPIPMPSFVTTAKTNGVFQFTWISLSNLTYQVQYSTNLASTNWLNLGGVITATNIITTAIDTNSIGTNPQRFYRVRRFP